MHFCSSKGNYIINKPVMVESNNFRKYFVVLLASVFGLLTHTAFIFLFYFNELILLVIASCISVLIWTIVIRENYLGRHTNAVYLCCIAVVCHAVLAVPYLGLDFGFQFYLWSLIGFASINSGKRKKSAVVLALLCITVFILLELVCKDQRLAQITALTADFILIVNILCAAGPLVLCIFSIQLMNEQHENRLSMLANTDELTGLYNRRYFNSYLNDYSELAIRNKTKFSLAIGDIDFFKKVNDQYGHNVGDEVLKQVSQYLKSNTRKSDVVCRWGGEEFIILFSDTDKPNALRVLEGIRASLSNAIHIGGNQEINITMSFGLVEYPIAEFSKKEDRLTNIELIGAADNLLYEAKSDGRNRIKMR